MSGLRVVVLTEPEHRHLMAVLHDAPQVLPERLQRHVIDMVCSAEYHPKPHIEVARIRERVSKAVERKRRNHG